MRLSTRTRRRCNSHAPMKTRHRDRITRLRGTGGDPDLGKRAAEENVQELENLLVDATMVFVTAGMGGGTGTARRPSLPTSPKQQGALTVGVVTLPFMFEGRPRQRNAVAGLDALRQMWIHSSSSRTTVSWPRCRPRRPLPKPSPWPMKCL